MLRKEAIVPGETVGIKCLVAQQPYVNSKRSLFDILAQGHPSRLLRGTEHFRHYL